MSALTYAQRVAAILHEADLRITQINHERDRQMTELEREFQPKGLDQEPAEQGALPWRELNWKDPKADYGTWIQEWPGSNSARIICFQPVFPDGFILRRGSITADLVHTGEFCGWDPAFEDVLNGFSRFKTRDALDVELHKLGILL